MTSKIDMPIVPIFRGPDVSLFAGTGFIMDNYLVTAGHVVSGIQDYFTYIDGKFVSLSVYDRVINRNITRETFDQDIAVYPFGGIGSILKLSELSHLQSDEVSVCCYQNTNEGLRMVITEGVICPSGTNQLIKLSTIQRITHGSSGGPIVQDNTIVGMVVMGNEVVRYDKETAMACGLSEDDIELLERMETNSIYAIPAVRINEFIKKWFKKPRIELIQAGMAL